MPNLKKQSQLVVLHTCFQRSLSLMYLFKGLTWIYINVVNLITMHVLIMIRSSCSIYIGMFRITNMWIAVFITY